MYQLTLTLEERKAINWIGHRYAHGNLLYKSLWVDCTQDPEDADWDDPRPITFYIPENVAWEIEAIAQVEEHQWDCFAPALAQKFEDLLDKVV